MLRRQTLTQLFVGFMLLGGAASAFFGGTEVFIASTGRGPGASSSQWYTTVWVHNPTGSTANVQFSFLLRNQTNPATPYVYNEAIAPGDTKRYDNAVFLMFGIEGFGAIRVVSDRSVLVNSRIYSTPSGGEDKDTVGQFFAAVPASFALAFGQSTQLLGAFQTTPAGSSQFRYNFGVVETSGNNVTVHVTVYDTTGTSLGAKNYSLGPYEVRQYAFTDEFPSISSTNARLAVDVIAGAGKVIAFGSGLANASNDPSTFEMAFDEALLAGGLATVAHDTTLTGDGTGLSPLGIANNGVGNTQLAGNAVSSSKIQDGQVANADLASNAVTTDKIQDGQVSANDLASNAVTSSKIQDGEVGVNDLASNAVTSAKIQDGQVGANDLATAAVTSSKVAVPLVLGAGASKTLEVTNNYSGGIPGATFRAKNSSAGSGIAGVFESEGTDATLVLGAGGTGVLFKAFGGNGGEDELRIDNNGTVHLYNSSHQESIKLDAASGKGTFKSIEVSGHANATVPIAYGNINSNGTKASGTANVSSSWNSGAGRYEITISGETYHQDNYATVVTVLAADRRMATTSSIDGKLLVYVHDNASNRIQDNFHFVVFKP